MMKKKKRVWALLLAAALLVTQLSGVAMAEDKTPKDGSIASFTALAKDVGHQIRPVGTAYEELDLPGTVTAEVYRVEREEGDTAADETGGETSILSENEAGGGNSGNIETDVTVVTSAEAIPVTWRCAPAYDSGIAGDYLFTAEVDGYPLAEGASLPEITVTLTEEAVKQQKTIVGWTFLDAEYLEEGVLALNGVNADNQADLETVVSMLPTAVMAEVSSGAAGAGATGGPETEKIEVGITGWSCTGYTQDEQGNWPVSGEYTFVAEPEPGYVWGTQPSVRVLFGGASVYVINDRFTVDGLRYKELGPDTVQLIGYKGDEPEGELHIPSQVVKPENGRPYEVVSIGSEAFAFCNKLTGSLVIPDTVTKIGNSAFMWCSFDGALVLPDGLTEIGDSAFVTCSFTGTLKLPDSLTEIGSRAFWDCTGFTGPLVIPKQITVIRDGTFTSCIGFESLEMPEGLTEIQSYALNGLEGIADAITLPSSLTLIGDRAFGLCNNVEFKCPNLTIAELLYESGSYLPDFKITVGGVGYDQLRNKDSFRIGTNPAMYYVKTGPDTVTAAGPGNIALYGILDIPQKVTNPGDGRTYTVTAIGEGAFRAQFITGVRIPDTVTKIGTGAFSLCDSLSGTLELPPGLTSIGDNAFSECQSLTGPLVIPDTVTEIGSNAFANCFALESLTLPPGLTEISDKAFYNCRNLSGSLNLPPALTRIGNNAFAYCTNLSGSLNLPSGLTHIGERAFFGCIGLKGGAFLDKNITSIGWQAFDPAFPLTTNSPRVQLLINEYNNRRTPDDTFWDGGEDIPDGALVTVNQDVTLEQDRRVGREAEITVDQNAVLTVNGALTLDGDMHLSGQFIINGSISGSGTLYVYRGARVVGDVSKIRVVYCWTEEIHNESRSSSRRASVWSGPLSYYLVPGDSISLHIPRADLQGLADAGLRLTLQCDTAKMSFTPAALRAILAAVPSTAGSVTFGARPADLSAYPAAAALIGGRPAYEFTIGSPGGNGEDVPVTAAFPAGAASVMLAYTPSAWEAGGSLSMVSVDGSGNASWLDKSSYGADFASVRGGAALQQRGGVLAEDPHFSIYGVAYRPSGQVLTDTAEHWAMDDILFAAVRGLLPGTGEGVFSPDAALTRGALAAALGRLAGVDTAGYQASGSFRDVPADAYYAPYVEWAVQNHIMGGTGEKQFSPGAAVTREQLAAMMGNYAAQQGYVLQTPFAAEAYADGDQISAEALPWVIFMQRAGVLYGREGKRFAPQEAATRGEGAAALRRLTEVGIDSDAARERRNNAGD